MRNAYAQTAVPPFAVRPRPGAPVAVPLERDELTDARLRPDRWTVRNLFPAPIAQARLWSEIGAHAEALGRARGELDRLRGG
jgi:bifunctional non-homologous end joining protein LigD